MTVTTSEPTCHIVFVPLAAWGHARPMCSLVARTVQSRPVIVSFFVPKILYHRMSTELSRNFDVDAMHLKSRVRLIALSCAEDNPLDIDVFYGHFADSYSKMVQEEPVYCEHTGEIVAAARAPDGIVADIFAHKAIRVARSLSPRVRAYSYTPTPASAAYRLVHLWRDDIEQGQVFERSEREAAEKGVDLAVLVKERFHTPTGKILDIPGLPILHDYEMYPQEVVTSLATSGLIQLALLDTLGMADGFIVSAPECVEADESLRCFRDWFAKTNRKLFTVGPLLPVAAHAVDQEKSLSPDAAKIDAFMNKVYATKGEKSMIYMSFGSLFWPTDPSKIWTFLDVLAEKQIPFVFAHGAKGANVPQEILDKVHSSGYGFLTSWAPQQSILAHPVTGWFVTHGGFNSIIESISAGTPMICWPYRAEQPLNAMHLTSNLDIAYELVEIRTGEHANKKICRTGRSPVGTSEAIRKEAMEVLSMAFGPDGDRKRANLLKLREKTSATWAEGGTSRRDLDLFLDELHA